LLEPAVQLHSCSVQSLVKIQDFYSTAMQLQDVLFIIDYYFPDCFY